MMVSIPKKVSQRFIQNVPKFKNILKNACDRDINEADTVEIVGDILSDIFGFDKYSEVTREYSIRRTFCDFAVKIDNSVKYLIEVKAISSELRETHLRQAVSYGANAGIQYVVLTNGIIWEIYSIYLKDKIHIDKIYDINFFELNPRKREDQEVLFMLAKEGFQKDAITDYQERIQCVNPF